MLRKERIHHSGASNLANSASKQFAQAQSSLLDSPSRPSPFKSAFPNLSSPHKTPNSSDIIHKKASRSVFAPQEETSKFYEDAHRSIKPKHKIGYPRTAQLEEKDKMKTVFTGESNLYFDKKLEKYRGDEAGGESPNMFTLEKKPKPKTKLTEHAQAIQETQLVGFDKYNAETLKNRVNLEKVREARRVLRRKYANRKNLQKIFSNWDEDSTGVITAENVFSMSKNLGLNLNFDEAKILLASANRTSSGVLNLDEFLDLIYNKDDVLNIDFKSLSSKLDDGGLLHRNELEEENNNVFSKLQEDAKKARETKRMNQLKLILKNKIPDLRNAILEIDRDRSGFVNLYNFEQACQRLRISENVLSREDIKSIYEKHKTDIKLDYRNFLQHLGDFKFDYDQEYLESDFLKSKYKKKLSIEELGSGTGGDAVDVVDCRDLPVNMIENFYGRSRKVGRAIQRFLPTKESLVDYLANKMKIGKEEVENKYLSLNDFRDIIKDMFHKFDVSHLHRRDLEGFLSSVLYNRHGFTDFKEVAHTIYDETEKQYFEKIQRRKKGIHPQDDIRYVEGDDQIMTRRFQTETQRLSQTLEEVPEKHEEVAPTDVGKVLKTESAKTERDLSRLPPLMKSNLLDLKKRSGSVKLREKQLDADLAGILKELDDKFFVGTKSAARAFKEFDVDGDGFVSHQDMAAKLEAKQLLPKQSVAKLLEYIDPEQKGFVDFSEFSAKIRPNMAFDDEMGEARGEVSKAATQFTKPDFQKTWDLDQWCRKTMKESKTVLGFETPSKGKKGTRYAAHPGWRNTFLNFQASSNSPMFVAEDERLYKHRLASTMFQVEAKMKQEKIQQSRIEDRRSNQNIILARIERENALQDAKEEAKRQKRWKTLEVNERNARLKNIYA